MAYRKVYFRIHTESYSSGWSSDTDRAAFKEESRRLFQGLGWAVTPGHNGCCDTVTKNRQDLYLHPDNFSGVIEEANIEVLQEQLTKARTFRCYHVDRYEEYQDLSDEEYRAELEASRVRSRPISWKNAEQSAAISTLWPLLQIILRNAFRSAVCATRIDRIRSGINSRPN